MRVHHDDLDLKYDAKYHVERYLEKKGIYLEMFEYKYEDIEDLVRHCREPRDIEYGITEEMISLARVESMQDGERVVGGDSFSSSRRSSPPGNPESSSQQPSSSEPIMAYRSLPLDSAQLEDSRPTISRTQSIPILSPTSARHRQSIMEDEHELQSLCHLQAPLPTLENYGTTPETLYSEMDIATPESVVHGHGTTTSKEMDEENENDYKGLCVRAWTAERIES